MIVRRVMYNNYKVYSRNLNEPPTTDRLNSTRLMTQSDTNSQMF